MRCPTCGQPDVRIRGDRWECTWCLDVGFLPSEVRRLRDQAREAAAREVESWIEWEENAAQRAGRLALEAVYAALKLLPPLAEREDLAWKAVICQATMALSYGDLRDVRWVSSPGRESVRREFYPYREVVYDLEKTSGLFGPGRQKKACLPVYWKEGGLALNHCGTFWKYIIAALPPCPEGEDPAFTDGCLFLPWPEDAPWEQKYEMERLLDNLCALMAFFAGEEGETADAYKNQLLRGFSRQWRTPPERGWGAAKVRTARKPLEGPTARRRHGASASTDPGAKRGAEGRCVFPGSRKTESKKAPFVAPGACVGGGHRAALRTALPLPLEYGAVGAEGPGASEVNRGAFGGRFRLIQWYAGQGLHAAETIQRQADGNGASACRCCGFWGLTDR